MRHYPPDHFKQHLQEGVRQPHHGNHGELKAHSHTHHQRFDMGGWHAGAPQAGAPDIHSFAPNPIQEFFGKVFGAFRGVSPTNAMGRDGVAVYNVDDRRITLPNGEQLEAHSGYGSRLDNPMSEREHGLGTTPSGVRYGLTWRESSFHGVDNVIRLNPLIGSTYGRTGLLVHPDMLGPRGDSNGCVSVPNLARFQQAFANHEIKYLDVVSSRHPRVGM